MKQPRKSFKANFGFGGFSDQYDNGRMKSMDRDQHQGGVTGTPFEDDFDIETNDYFPDHGESPVRSRGFYHSHSSRPTPEGLKEWKRSDEKIKDEVQMVLNNSHEVENSGIEIEVENGYVTLNGTIESRGMQQVAQDLVASIPAVEDVFTNLKIKQE